MCADLKGTKQREATATGPKTVRLRDSSSQREDCLKSAQKENQNKTYQQRMVRPSILEFVLPRALVSLGLPYDM